MAKMKMYMGPGGTYVKDTFFPDDAKDQEMFFKNPFHAVRFGEQFFNNPSLKSDYPTDENDNLSNSPREYYATATDREYYAKGGNVKGREREKNCHVVQYIDDMKDIDDDDDERPHRRGRHHYRDYREEDEDHLGRGSFEVYADEVDPYEFPDEHVGRNFKRGGSISIEISHPGALHRKMGIPEDKKIPVDKLDKEMRMAKRTGDKHLQKQVQFAKNARKFKHD